MGFSEQFDPHTGGFIFAEGKMVTPHAQLHRIAQGRETDNLEFDPGGQPHLEESLPLLGWKVKSDDAATLADVQSAQDGSG